MADINAVPARKGQSTSGEWGNLFAVHFTYTLAAAQIADIVLLGQIPANAKVIDINMRNAALGAGTTIALGYRAATPGSALVAAPTAYLAATSTASAATTRGSFAPNKQAEDLFLIATVGGGAATGQLDVTVFYQAERG